MEQADIESGHRVLDLGCGTGTLALLIKRTQQEAEVVGLDGDHKFLEIAKAKVARSGQEITMDYGMAYELPYPCQHRSVFEPFHRLEIEPPWGMFHY